MIVCTCLPVLWFLRSLFNLGPSPTWPSSTIGPKPPPKRATPKLSALKMDMDDVQNDIDYLKSKSFILCDMYSFQTLSCNRQRGIKKDNTSINPETKPAYDTKTERTTWLQERWLQPARWARTWKKQIKIWCTSGVVVCHKICCCLCSNQFCPGWNSTGDGQVLQHDT